MKEETIILTDSEQNLYNSLSEAEKSLFRLLRLTRKVEQREIMAHLQDVSQAVREVKALQKRQLGWSVTLSRLWKKVIAFINSEIHKINLDDNNL